jgi:rsbT co-antagonist protein RsbR
MSDPTATTSDLAAENAALRAELARYTAIVEHMSLGVFVYKLEDPEDDRTLRMVAANPAAEPLAGVAPTELVGRTIDECFPALRAQGLPAIYAGVVRTGTPFEAEVIYGDERVVTSAFLVRAFQIPGGETAVCFDNITQRKQAELDLHRLNAELEERVAARAGELEQSQRLLRHVLDSSPSAIYIKDLEGRFLLANQKAAVLMGLTPETLVGRADHELFPAEYVDQWRAAERQVTQGHCAVEQEEQAPQADGIHTFISSRTPVFDEQGAIYAIGGVSTDITERTKAEEALRQSQHRLQTIIDSLPSAVFWKDRDSIYQGCNLTFARFAGVGTPEAIVGKSDHDLPWAGAEADSFRAYDRKVMDLGVPELNIVETQLHADGKRSWANTNKIPLRGRDGEVIGLLGTYQDITEQKQAEDERLALQTQVIEAQQHALRELSTPLLPLSERVVLMPIVGAMDSRRAQQVVETLLQGVSEHNASLAIVDITGVQVVDTQVANAFIQSARAVQLLGARVMLTGIRPEVAQTLVQLGVDLQGITTRGSLQAGIAYAFSRQ